METEFISCVERVFKETIINEQLIVEGDTKTVEDMQFEPKTRQILLQFTDGSAYTVHKDQPLEFVTPVKRPRIKPTKKI